MLGKISWELFPRAFVLLVKKTIALHQRLSYQKTDVKKLVIKRKRGNIEFKRIEGK